jgi:DNA-binding protein H-NS
MHETDPGIFPDDADVEPRALSRRERAAVIARIQALVEFWGITEAELEGDLPPPPEPTGPLPIKYRHPVTGETWDGQGPHPDWLRRALLKEGMRVEELRPVPESASGPELPSP